jgi:hypothetical protein
MVRHLTVLESVAIVVGLWVLSKVAKILRRRAKTTQLKGPPRMSWMFGVSRFLSEHKDSSLVQEQWAEQYGNVFRVPIAMGQTVVALCDPKAIQHFYSKESFTYVDSPAMKIVIERIVCVHCYLPE